MKIRNALSVVIGVIAGFIIIILGEGIVHAANTLPAGVDMRDPQAVRQFIANAPVHMHLSILGIYAIACFVGGLTSSSIATEKKMSRAMTLGGIFMGIGTFSLVSVGHPIWVVVISFLVFLPFAYLGGLISVRNAKKKEEAKNKQ